MSNKSFLDGLSLLIESPDIPDEIRDKLWEVYDKYKDETNPQKQYDALLRIHSLINRAKIKQEEKYQRIIAEIFDEPKSFQSSGLYNYQDFLELYTNIIKSQGLEPNLIENQGKTDVNEDIVSKWKEQYNKIEEAERITFKPISKLSESEVNDLCNKLKEKGFIAPDTEVERLKHILSGDKYDGYKPMVWIKKQTRNQKPSKASVIDFLYLLGIKQENINPKRLNCCFICSDDNSYSPFGYNNINTKKSEFHEILKEIIELVFFKNHVILQFVGKEENNTDSKPSKQ